MKVDEPLSKVKFYVGKDMKLTGLTVNAVSSSRNLLINIKYIEGEFYDKRTKRRVGLE